MNIVRGICRANYTTSMATDMDCCLRSLKPYRKVPAALYDRHKDTRLQVIWPGIAEVVFEVGTLRAWTGQNGHDKHHRLAKSHWSLL